jgi:hypothetical protein
MAETKLGEVGTELLEHAMDSRLEGRNHAGATRGGHRTYDTRYYYRVLALGYELLA